MTPLHRMDAGRIRAKRTLRVGRPEIHWFETGDKFRLRLTRYRGGNKGPVILSHGLGVSSLIFTIDTIETNLLEYLYDMGYDCWLLDYRASIDLPYADDLWTADQVATEDYPAAVDKVRVVTGADQVQVVAHCYGATTFVMAMMQGLQHIRSAVISQIAVDAILPWWPQRFLATIRAPSLLRILGVSALDAKATTVDGWGLRLLDGLVRFVVPRESNEGIQSATSNRISAFYGPLYKVDQLNRATYLDGLPEMFGKANVRAFAHLAVIARKTYVVDARGRDVYTPHIDSLNIPICFIHGAENRCYKPQSTERTYDRLVERYGSEHYERHIIAGYGHIDCIFGADAVSDVYPHVLNHLNKTQAG